MTESAHVTAENARNVSRDLRADLDKLLNDINEFTTGDRAKPSQIRQLADEIQNRSISLSQEEIMQLALQINQTILGLTNIDAIIAETARDASIADSLKERANDARFATALLCHFTHLANVSHKLILHP